MTKTSADKPAFEIAQALAPKAALLAWLDQQAATTLLRVPVEVEVSVLGTGGASLGFGADRLRVELDDSALGEPLADHARTWCGDHPTCAMWVWANWRAGGLRATKAEAAIPVGERAAATHLFVAK